MQRQFQRAGSIGAALLAAAALASCAWAPARAARVDASALETDLKSSLARDARLAERTNVDVDPTTGVVRLSGRVANAEERANAGRLACSVKGVTVVYNEIEIQRVRR